jgi:plastocyanin
MNQAAVWVSILIVIVLVGGGVFLYRSTTPQETANMLATNSPDVSPNGFLQYAPGSSPITDSDQLAATPTASTSPLTSPAAKGTVTISMTDTGFSPATVTVKLGTTVRFVNNGQAPHWPASDPHPIHNGLPGFDAKHGLQTGEEYSFTFTKVGTWGFHDHLNISSRGAVIVQ